MTIGEVKRAFIDKKDIPCPLTEALVKAGYQQESGGYIKYAQACGIKIDYKQNSPSQYFHLIYSYCLRRDENKLFTKNIVCGELIFWMAESSRCIYFDELTGLLREIKSDVLSYNKQGRPIYDRRKWNKIIQQVCFDSIVEYVENWNK